MIPVDRTDGAASTEVRRDELMKLLNLPPWQFEPLFAELEPHIRGNKNAPALFADLLLPAAEKVHRAQWRLEQRLALLRHVEALRLYAAAHDGALPAKLSDIPVPLPDDPFTGKPFRYEVTGQTAHLRGSPPPAEPAHAPATASQRNAFGSSPGSRMLMPAESARHSSRTRSTSRWRMAPGSVAMTLARSTRAPASAA